MNTAKRIISSRECARQLGRSPSTVECGLRNGTFPIGTAYKTDAGRYVYIIPRDAFDRFMRGEIRGNLDD